MKVLHVLGGGAWGGGSVVVLAITRALIARGDQVWVIALDDETAEKFREAGAVAVRTPMWFRPISPLDIVPLISLWWLCLRRRFHLVVTHTSKGGFLGRIAARLAGVPNIVHHIHGFAFHMSTPPIKVRFYAVLERIAGRCCDLLVTVGEQHRRTAIRLGLKPPDRIRTVLNGIDLTRFLNVDRAAARRTLGFHDGDVVLGSNGRLSDEKGFDFMIRAMPAILARHPNARLVIAGAGPAEAELRTLIGELNLDGRVAVLGFRRDIPELLAAFDVFVHSSLREGLSISLIEAMAAGLPIVASRIWGNMEMIESGVNGLLAPPSDAPAIAEAVCSLLDDPARARRLAATARRDALRRFTEDRMVAENLAVYDAVAHRESPGRARADRAPAGVA